MTFPTADDDEDGLPHEYASPACFMHEVDPAYFGLPAKSDNNAAKQAPPEPLTPKAQPPDRRSDPLPPQARPTDGSGCR